MSAPESRLTDFLDHILEALRRISMYTDGITEEDFRGNLLVQDGVMRNLEIIGEAARNVERVAPDFVRCHADVPWSAAIAMRNRISHGYFSVDLPIIWRTLRSDLPALE